MRIAAGYLRVVGTLGRIENLEEVVCVEEGVGRHTDFNGTIRVAEDNARKQLADMIQAGHAFGGDQLIPFVEVRT